MSRRRRKTIGWREWVQLPQFGVNEMKVKVDTGADSSSLHAFNLERFSRDDGEWVRFEIHPRQRSRKPAIVCEALVVKERKVKNPGGRTELRPVIRTRPDRRRQGDRRHGQPDHPRRDELSNAGWTPNHPKALHRRPGPELFGRPTRETEREQ